MKLVRCRLLLLMLFQLGANCAKLKPNLDEEQANNSESIKRNIRGANGQGYNYQVPSNPLQHGLQASKPSTTHNAPTPGQTYGIPQNNFDNTISSILNELTGGAVHTIQGGGFPNIPSGSNVNFFTAIDPVDNQGNENPQHPILVRPQQQTHAFIAIAPEHNTGGHQALSAGGHQGTTNSKEDQQIETPSSLYGTPFEEHTPSTSFGIREESSESSSVFDSSGEGQDFSGEAPVSSQTGSNNGGFIAEAPGATGFAPVSATAGFAPAAPGFAPATSTTAGFVPAAPTTSGFAPAAPATSGFAPVAPATSGFSQTAPATPGFAQTAPATPGFAQTAPSTAGFAPAAPSTTGFAPAAPSTTGLAPATPGFAPAAPATPGFAQTAPALATAGISLAAPAATPGFPPAAGGFAPAVTAGFPPATGGFAPTASAGLAPAEFTPAGFASPIHNIAGLAGTAPSIVPGAVTPGSITSFGNVAQVSQTSGFSNSQSTSTSDSASSGIIIAPDLTFRGEVGVGNAIETPIPSISQSGSSFSSPEQFPTSVGGAGFGNSGFGVPLPTRVPAQPTSTGGFTSSQFLNLGGSGDGLNFLNQQVGSRALLNLGSNLAAETGGFDGGSGAGGNFGSGLGTSGGFDFGNGAGTSNFVGQPAIGSFGNLNTGTAGNPSSAGTTNSGNQPFGVSLFDTAPQSNFQGAHATAGNDHLIGGQGSNNHVKRNIPGRVQPKESTSN